MKHEYGSSGRSGNSGGFGGGGHKAGKDRGTGFSERSKHGRKTIGMNYVKGGLTPVASLGSNIKTNGVRMPVKVTGSGHKKM